MEVKHADLSSLKIDRSKKTSGGGGWKIYIISAVILLAAVIGFINKDSFFNPAPEVTTVTLTQYTPSQVSSVLNASGYVVAQRKAAVASKGTGRLVFLGVVEGDKVTKDQIIARLEDTDVIAALNAAKAALLLSEADLKDAENQLKREKEMLQSGATSQMSFENAEARYLRVLANIAIAKAQIEAQEVNLENTRIRAPFNGTVLTKNADVGEIVAPFAASASSRAAVVTIADMSSLEVETDVSESNIYRIEPGQPCEITLDAYSDIRYQGYVTKIVPTADRAKATVLVKVGFRNYDSRVLPEMGAKVAFLNKDAEVSEQASKSYTVLPVTAVRDRDGKKYVYILAGGMAEEKEITTGELVGSFIEVTGGLASGERVINNLTDALQAGSPVKQKGE
ncbi:MAG: Macrolide export protein MacA [Ignavibacteriaceae bacterium]|nr:Macrolide export protein MacA [Ignavibacteriaceae bacterium]